MGKLKTTSGEPPTSRGDARRPRGVARVARFGFDFAAPTRIAYHELAVNTNVGKVLDVIEAAYAPIDGKEPWLRNLAERFHSALGDGSGTMVLSRNPRPGATQRFELSVGVGVGAWWREQVALLEGIPENTYRAFEQAGTILLWSRIFENVTSHDPATTAYYEQGTRALLGATDAEVIKGARAGTWSGIPAERLALGCLDAEGRGVGVIVPLREIAKAMPTREQMSVWSRVAAHVAAGARLHRSGVLGTTDRAEAVLEPGGRVCHAEGAAKRPSALEALRTAAVLQDRARARSRRASAERATAQWNALVAGRWSLVDVFERDSRRYVVARPNVPEAAPRPELTTREAQVVACAALGHSNKQIAYELGLAPATVSGHLARAADKLGVRSRVELVRMIAARG
jgi:DNA-binding CsgD family transcriptional regulator